MLCLIISLTGANAYAADLVMAENTFMLGDWPATIAQYESIVETDPTSQHLNRLGEAFMYNHDFELAEKAFALSLKKAETARARTMLMMLEALRDKEKLPAFMGMADKQPTNHEVWFAAGFLNVQLKKYDEALTYLEKAASIEPDDYMTYFFIGYCYEITNRYDDAIKAYKVSVNLNPNYAQAVNNLGYNYKERAYYSYAIEMYERAITLMPKNAGYYYNVGNAYTHKNYLKKAFYAYRTAVALDPKFAKAHYNLGRSLAEMGFYEDAIPHLQLYIKYWSPEILVVDAPLPDNVLGQIETINEFMAEREEEYQSSLNEGR